MRQDSLEKRERSKQLHRHLTHLNVSLPKSHPLAGSDPESLRIQDDNKHTIIPPRSIFPLKAAPLGGLSPAPA